MPPFKLMLYTQQPPATPVAALVQALQNIGLCGAQLRLHDYAAGSKLIDHLSFLGCSPAIQLSPDDGDNYCFIRFNPLLPDIQCLGFTETATPRCPSCKNKITHWQSFPHWQTGNTTVVCPNCNTQHRMMQLKWKQEGGYGVMVIEIFNIHPFEAVPTEDLLLHLKNISAVEWDYFYSA